MEVVATEDSPFNTASVGCEVGVVVISDDRRHSKTNVFRNDLFLSK